MSERAPQKSPAELLQEAKLLAEMGGEWTIAHAAAFCTVSPSFMYRAGCPRIEKQGERGATDRSMIRYEPDAVKAWNAARTEAKRARRRARNLAGSNGSER